VKEDPNLVANGRFQCLVTFGRRMGSILFTSFHFPPNKFDLNLLFFIDLKVLFYHGLYCYLHLSFLFLEL
jgi:hypothetical protein